MGIARRRERQRAELREQILAAARDIVLREGFAGLSMRKIAEAVEYSAATLYLYFANREEIALTLCREGFSELLLALAPAAGVADPQERLFAIGRAYVRFGIDHPETYRLIFMEDSDLSSEVVGAELDAADDPGERAFAILEATVRELTLRGDIQEIDAEHLAQVIWAPVHGLVSLGLSSPKGGDFFNDMDRLTTTMLEMIARGLRP